MANISIILIHLVLFHSYTLLQAHEQSSKELNDFLTALENAETDLRWIETTAIELRSSKKEKRDSFLSSPFDSAVKTSGNLIGDDWYTKLRRRECDACHCCGPVILDDANGNKEPNSLYDEAEYQPLSKFEQDPTLKKLPRSVNPANEIKLKISTRMQKEGHTASLPSDMYGDTPKIQFFDVSYPAEEPIENQNLFKRDANVTVMKRRIFGLPTDQDLDFAKNAKTYAIHPKVTVNGIEVKNETDFGTLVMDIKSLHKKLTTPNRNYEEIFEVEGEIARKNRNTRQNDYENILSGKAMKQLIESVHDMIEKDPNLKKTISPYIKSRSEALRSVYQEKSSKNQKPCASLSPELQEYFDKITASGKGLIFKEIEEKTSGRNRYARNVDPTEIHQKYEVLNTLIKQFGTLSAVEQEQYATVKELLLKDISLLDEIKEILNCKDIEVQPRPEKEQTPQYERLAQAIDFIHRHQQS